MRISKPRIRFSTDRVARFGPTTPTHLQAHSSAGVSQSIKAQLATGFKGLRHVAGSLGQAPSARLALNSPATHAVTPRPLRNPPTSCKLMISNSTDTRQHHGTTQPPLRQTQHR
jgi:hypothetical protein